MAFRYNLMRNMQITLFCCLIIACKNIPEKNQDPSIIFIKPSKTFNNFHQTKKAAKKIFAHNPKTFYCGCNYNEDDQIDFNSCGYVPKKNSYRAHRIEWEHITSAKEIGSTHQCWSEAICQDNKGIRFKGRKCCDIIDNDYKLAANDLHNLVPAIGEINQARGAKKFTNTVDSEYEFGQCRIKFNQKLGTVEPDPKLKGPIARSYLYMSTVHNVPLSIELKQLFKEWNEHNPPELWEKEWNNAVKEVQGNDNPYITFFASK